MDLRCDTTGDNLHLLEVNSGHKTRVNKMVNLYSYLGRVRSPVVDPDKVEQAATGKKKLKIDQMTDGPKVTQATTGPGNIA